MGRIEEYNQSVIEKLLYWTSTMLNVRYHEMHIIPLNEKSAKCPPKYSAPLFKLKRCTVLQFKPVPAASHHKYISPKACFMKFNLDVDTSRFC